MNSKFISSSNLNIFNSNIPKRKLIEDEISDGKSDTLNSKTVISDISLSAQSKVLQQNIDKASSLMIDFWAQVLEDYPGYLLLTFICIYILTS